MRNRDNDSSSNSSDANESDSEPELAPRRRRVGHLQFKGALFNTVQAAKQQSESESSSDDDLMNGNLNRGNV